MHFEVSLQADVARVRFQSKPMPMPIGRLQIPAGRSNQSLSVPGPTVARFGFYPRAQCFEPRCEEVIETEPGEAERRFRKFIGMQLPPKTKSDALRLSGASLQERIPQTEAAQYRDSLAADEFAADSMPGIRARFENVDSHRLVPQGQAERESSQTSADNGDFFWHAEVTPPSFFRKING